MTNEPLWSLDGRVTFMPVRHHSPLSSLVARRLIDRLRPSVVLIEGPSDYNEHLDELSLPHRLPIAIYSYRRDAGGAHRGAYYPFCIYSPEWQALAKAKELSMEARFIDIPLASHEAADMRVNLYSDLEYRRSSYIDALCRELGVDSFDALWDELFETHRDLGDEEYLERMHRFCLAMREHDGHVSNQDTAREAFMAGEIQKAMAEREGRILVITGGFHSAALRKLVMEGAPAPRGNPVQGEPWVKDERQGAAPLEPEAGGTQESGIALTPYSYERLDGLAGYEAGMPNPGFYHLLWEGKSPGEAAHNALRLITGMLRKRKQHVSAAETIALKTTALALAQLRGHGEIWREDLLDAHMAVLIKEELSPGRSHPMLEAVHEVLRGFQRGALARGTRRPPLAEEIDRELVAHGIDPHGGRQEFDLDLSPGPGREKSALLHRLSILSIAGITLLQGPGSDSPPGEQWRIAWSPDSAATVIEAARYGATLPEACSGKLLEDAETSGATAAGAASLLLQAAQARLDTLAGGFMERLELLVHQDSRFESVTGALKSLYWLYLYEQALETAGKDDQKRLLTAAFERALWLMEAPASLPAESKALLDGIGTLHETFLRCEEPLALENRAYFELFSRIYGESSFRPVLRGAALGIIAARRGREGGLEGDFSLLAGPERLGDFLTGLFFTARETVKRNRGLLKALHDIIAAWSEGEFLAALPPMRLAFSYFTPGEKHHMALNLLELLGLKERMLTFEIDEESHLEAMALEGRIFEIAREFGLLESHHE